MANEDYQERQLTPSIKVNKIDRDTFNQKLGEGVLSRDELYFIVPKNQLDKVLDIPTGETGQGGGIQDPSDKTEGQYLMFDGTSWVASDIEIPPQIDAYTKAETDELLDEKADVGSIPTSTSDLANDSGFITSADIPAIPSKTSDLTNDSGFITSAELPPQTYSIIRRWETRWDGLTFTAKLANSTIKLQKNGSPPDVSLQYSVDGGSNWSNFIIGNTYTLANIGDTIQIRATSTNPYGMGYAFNAYLRFAMTGKIAASGNIMSLYDVDFGTKSIAMTNYGFCGLFMSCTSLTQAPELPATTLAGACYRQMFNGCSSLVQAPELPATTMATGCYYNLFRGCTSLVSITSAISSTDLASGSYTTDWLRDASTTGTFTYLDPDFDPSEIATRSVSTVPSGWTISTVA